MRCPPQRNAQRCEVLRGPAPGRDDFIRRRARLPGRIGKRHVPGDLRQTRLRVAHRRPTGVPECDASPRAGRRNGTRQSQEVLSGVPELSRALVGGRFRPGHTLEKLGRRDRRTGRGRGVDRHRFHRGRHGARSVCQRRPMVRTERRIRPATQRVRPIRFQPFAAEHRRRTLMDRLDRFGQRQRLWTNSGSLCEESIARRRPTAATAAGLAGRTRRTSDSSSRSRPSWVSLR